MTVVIVLIVVALLMMGGLLAVGLKVALGQTKTPPAHDEDWREAREAWASGRSLEPSPEAIWTARKMLVRTDGEHSQVYDAAGRPMARIDRDGLTDLEGRPQIRVRHNFPKRFGGVPRDVLHPDGSSYGRLTLDRQAYRSLRLHLYDPLGNRVAGFRTLDRNGTSIVIEDSAGRPLAAVRRAYQHGARAEDAVELLAPLEGGFHALVLMAALRAATWQRSEWQVVDRVGSGL
jgi:YD repeat-containing protein